ncbi:hypothetical protein RND81_10G132100 [Saponaria officinalis]|uniref:Uncharacterized protein n=1 Tax=Saponaria officinalis TaxID=3572 RepID=A0AAW1I471_SAPOF
MSVSVEDKENYEFEFESGCRTPRHGGITVDGVCPPAPRKKRVYANHPVVGPPKGGFFKPPDLESIFAPLTVKQDSFVICRTCSDNYVRDVC